jgi:hypothetical protein
MPRPWKPGESGNPNGRPLKNRALTTILEQAGNRTILDATTGKAHARKRILARLVWQLATEGKVTLPNNANLVLDPADWIGLVKWIYQHVDGPPKSEVDVTSGGEKIIVTLKPDDD